MPITWRNVSGPSPADASRPLELARQTFDGAFDSFGRIIKQREALDASNLAAQDEGAKQAYLEQLAQAKTPEELAALQASGSLDAMRQKLTSVARGQTAGALEARNTGLRQKVAADLAYNDGLTSRAEAPERDEVTRLVSQGNFDGATAFLDMSKLRNKGPLYAVVEQARRAKFVQGRDDTTAERAATLATMNLNEAQRKAAEAETSRAVDATANEFASNAQFSKSADLAEIQRAADTYTGPKVPRRTDGSIASEMMKPEEKAAFNAYLTSNEVPTLDAYDSGNTQSAARLRASLRAAGHKPTDIARVEAMIPSLLGTTQTAAIGNDAEAAARAQRMSDTLAKENGFKYGQVATPESVEELLKVAIPAIKDITEEGSWKRETYIEKITELLQKGGIKKGELRVLPSPAQLELLIRGTKQTWGRSADTEITDAIKGWTDNTETIKAADEAVRLQNERYLKALK